MKLILFVALCALLCGFALAADEKAAIPVISDAELVDFFQSQSDLATAIALDFVSKAAKEDYDTKSNAFSAEIGRLGKLCGDKFDLQLNEKRRPACVAKPAAAPAPAAIGGKPSK